jgi:hypothetical protein
MWNTQSGELLLIILYGDDLLLTGNNEPKVAVLEKDPLQTFEMKGLGVLLYYLAMEVCEKIENNFLS